MPARTDKKTEAIGAVNGTRPPLKWAGSKYRLVPHIRRLLPEGKRLVEPFVGSGAVFLNTDYERYRISDANTDLILFYKTLKRGQKSFIEHARKYFTPKNNVAKRYYALRDEFNELEKDDPNRAALFLYLNKHGYNGLCRYNASGELNVPFGRYYAPYFPEREMNAFLARAHRATITILNRDFEDILKKCNPGDVVYCDPPYVPLSTTSNFTAYSSGGFGPEDQKRLAKLALVTAQRGIPVLISNHDTPATRELYAAASKMEFLDVRRLISCNSAKRENAAELLALFLPD
ncbi:MAG: Dam family site-specific DNA-(adenine-N6)-methyltransferase [Gammaproteobacteria bacterium]